MDYGLRTKNDFKIWGMMVRKPTKRGDTLWPTLHTANLLGHTVAQRNKHICWSSNRAYMYLLKIIPKIHKYHKTQACHFNPRFVYFLPHVVNIVERFMMQTAEPLIFHDSFFIQVAIKNRIVGYFFVVHTALPKLRFILKRVLYQGPFLYYVRTWGWEGGLEMAIFPYFLYIVKMSLRRWVGGSKKPQNTLT